MQIQAIRTNQITFRDDNTYIPPSYSAYDAMADLSKQGYIIQGNSTKDAFEKAHDEINKELERKANAPDGVWEVDLAQGHRYNDRSVKRAVVKWTLPKEDFSGLLTRFWSVNNSNSFKNIKESIANFLINYEGLEKPSFFTRIKEIFNPSKYTRQEMLLENVTNLFLKKGQHKLK